MVGYSHWLRGLAERAPLSTPRPRTPPRKGDLVGRLTAKVALITGAARGIGRATATRFYEEGCKVVRTDIADAAGIEAARLLGEGAEYQHLDVRREADWRQALAHISERYDRLDVLVNNAGIGGFVETRGPHDPENLDLESWRAVHATNLDGVRNHTKSVALYCAQMGYNIRCNSTSRCDP